MVSCVEEAFVAKVEEAMSENGVVPLSHRAVEVALTAEPLYVVGVHANAPLPVIVTGEEPRMVKVEHESEPAQGAVVVETPNTPAPPFETRSCAEVGWVVVARPV